MSLLPFFDSRIGALALGLAAMAVVIAPFTSRPAPPAGTMIEDPAWPARINGQPVRELPLSDAELRFAEDFPGRIKRLTDGRHVYILRWVTRPTRKLHPAADCFRGAGYEVQPLDLVKDAAGLEWGCFAAKRGEAQLRVTERIWDTAGNSWTDVQAWFWEAALGRSAGPWWAMTEVR